MPAWGKGPNDKPKWLSAADKAKTTRTESGWVYEHKNGNKELLVAMYIPDANVPALVNTVAPALSGTGVVGTALTVTNGTWTGSAPITYTRVWQRDGVTIAGQTGSTYTVVAGDVDKAITAVVTAKDSTNATLPATSNAITGVAE